MAALRSEGKDGGGCGHRAVEGGGGRWWCGDVEEGIGVDTMRGGRGRERWRQEGS